MAGKQSLLLYAAAYGRVDAALADLEAIEELHDNEVIGFQGGKALGGGHN